MFGFLNNPYPFNDDLRHNAKIIFFISLGVLAFIIFYQPIELNSFSRKEIIYLISGIAASTFLILSLNLIVLPSFFPSLFDNNKWDIKREILLNLWTLLTISSVYYLFYSKIFEIIIIDVFDITRIIFLGSIPVAALIVINQNRLLRFHLKSAQQMNIKRNESKQQLEKLLYFESDYKKDNLVVKANSIILIKSADNYIEVYYESEGIIKNQMIRSSLIKVEHMLEEFDFIFKCHRSFIVNINYIKEIEGNYLGYKLYFENINFYALVSQKYIDDFKKKI